MGRFSGPNMDSSSARTRGVRTRPLGQLAERPPAAVAREPMTRPCRCGLPLVRSDRACPRCGTPR